MAQLALSVQRKLQKLNAQIILPKSAAKNVTLFVRANILYHLCNHLNLRMLRNFGQIDVQW